jgi:hypothetical protein
VTPFSFANNCHLLVGTFCFHLQET